MSIGPAEIKQIGIALRMNFQDTFISETELSTERKKKPDNGPKNEPKENKGKLEESKSPLLKKSKVLNKLA